ncbi:MAG: amino acid adenylation domain-containing protein [Nitrospirota bacterium]
MQQEVEVQGFRLSPQQKRLWGFQQHGAVSYAQAVIRLDGVIDDSRLRTALRKVVARHQSLRTNFYREAGVKIPFQVISEQVEVPWRSLDLRCLEDSRHHESVEAELAAGRAASVSWECGSLLSATWCIFSPERSVLLLDIPALCADRCSLQNLASELARWYREPDAEEIADEPVQYAQFSEWQNELLAEGEAEAGRGWWAKQQLASYPALTLPFERPSDAPDSCFSLHSIKQDVPEDVVVRLEQIAHDRQVSLEVVLYVCWQVWLARVTRQRDLVCWWRCHGRPYEELREGIGLFERWLPVYGLFDPQISVHDLISRAVKAHAHAIEWQEYFPSETNSAQLNALTDPIGFEYERIEGPCRIEQGTLTLERSILSTEPFKLRLTCSQRDRVLRLTWHYSLDRIPHESLQYFADQFTALLRSVPEHVNDPIEILDMVGMQERQRLIRTLNDTVRSYDGLAPLHRLFEGQAGRQPDAPALVAADCALTYAELNARANRVAHGLIRRGVKRGDCVGVCLERSGEMIIGLLGVLKAGAAYVPVDPAHAAVRLVPQMTQSGATIVLAQSESTQLWPGFDGTVLGLGESSSVFATEPDTDPTLPMSLDDLAYVIYTSGSTGVPKGVAITHGNVVNYTRALCRQLDMQEPLQFATVSTLSADLGNTAIFPSLASGGCLHIITYETATDGQLFSAYLVRHPIDVLKIVPSHFKALMVTAAGAHIFPRKYLIMGGERLSCELADQVTRQASCAVMNHYGPTETTIGALTCPVLQAEERRLSINVPIGRPIDNLEAYILDKRLETVPVGVPGELYLGGEGLARGYLGQPDRTAERFVPHLHTSQSGARLYRTGDVARYWPDGRIEFLGRVDHQVKIRGFRIELGEIEAALAQHPAVQDAVVTAHEDRHGEDNLAAYLVMRGPEADGRTIQDFLRSRLPDYMIPTMVMFLPAMPLSANGKVDRHALPEPDQGRGGERMFVTPRTATEEILAGLWSEVLKRDAVGVQDNFFDLGGHSLLATQVMSRLRQAFRVDLPLRTLFDAPSIAQLADVVDAARALGASDESPAMLPVPRSGPIPLSFAQQRLWILAQLDPDSAAYNIPIALRVLGPLDTVALQQSFDEVVRRHEVLRTTFKAINGEPIQVITPSLIIPLPVVDLQHVSEHDRQAAAVRLATAEAQRPFDLQYGPLLRINALRLNPDEHVLLLTLHHIVSDAWSAHVLVREVTALYSAFIEGRPLPLSDLPIQYADFSQWQHAWLSGSVLERELGYWKDVLSGELPILHLPTDRPRPVIQSSHGAIETLVLTSEISAAGKELSRRTSATIYMTLLTAWYLLLFRYTGQKDLIIGTPIANRTRREVENLIGFFVNTLAMRMQVDGYAPVSEIIANVREACLEAYAHQETPFEKLVEVLQPRRDVGRAPIFQVMFDLQNAPSSELDVQSLEFLPLEVDSRTAKFDLSMTVQELDHQFAISIVQQRPV